MAKRHEYTDWKFPVPPLTLGVSRGREKKERRKKKAGRGGEGGGNYGRKAKRDAAGLAHVCAYVKPEADTDRDGRMGETVTAGLKR